MSICLLVWLLLLICIFAFKINDVFQMETSQAMRIKRQANATEIQVARDKCIEELRYITDIISEVSGVGSLINAVIY